MIFVHVAPQDEPGGIMDPAVEVARFIATINGQDGSEIESIPDQQVNPSPCLSSPFRPWLRLRAPLSHGWAGGVKCWGSGCFQRVHSMLS